MQLKREDIIGKNRPPVIRKVATPEWQDNAYVYVRQLRTSEVDEITRLSSRVAQNGRSEECVALGGWCVLGICDKNGTRILKEADLEALLDEAPLAAVRRCAEAVMELNGIGELASETQKKTRQPIAPVRIPARKRTRAGRR